MLRLEVVEFEDDGHWRWRLLDAGGAFVADHVVDMPRDAAEYSGWVDAYGYLRWSADPERGAAGERALVERLAQFIGAHVWGDVGAALAERAASAPVVVEVGVPAAAEVLLYRPLELGFVDGRPLAEHDVTLIFGPAGSEAGGGKQPIGERLRMLALFSVPTDQAALNARNESYELRRLVRRVAHTAGRAIELRVLQYGVTRERLSEVLAESEGWDIVHFSGHGLPAGLVLERPDGTADVVPSDELVTLLWPARERLKLVALSACESAAATVTQAMELLGIPLPADLEAAAAAEGRPLPAVAQELVARLRCAALAMRYPVGDEFAMALARHLYEALLRDGQSLPRALQLAVQKALAPTGRRLVSPLSVATPALFGATAAELSLEPPAGEPMGFDVSTPGLAYFEPEPERFVGRVGPLARASTALAPDAPQRAVLFHGMAGAGKTACALELAYRHQDHRFEAMAWHRAPLEGQDISTALADFAVALETQLPGLELAYAVDDRQQLERLLPRFRRLLQDNAVLVVLDNVESLLTPAGRWRDERWELLIEAFVSHDGLSRLVLTSRYPLDGAAGDARVLVEQIDALSASESILLVRQLPNLGLLFEPESSPGPTDGRTLVRSVLEVVQGNPQLIELADREAADLDGLRERVAQATAAWGSAAGRLGAFFATGQHDRDYGAQDFLRVLEAWTAGAAARLSDAARLMFEFLCAIEYSDRLGLVISDNWAALWRRVERPDPPPEPHAVLAEVAAQGLISIHAHDGDPDLDRISLHPAVEHAGRSAAPATFQEAVDEELSQHWMAVLHEGLNHEASDPAGGAVVWAGLAAAPYLMRLDKAEAASFVLERVLGRDKSSRTLAAVLPYLEQLAERAVGPRELRAQAALLRARGFAKPVSTVEPLRALLGQAETGGDEPLVYAILGMLQNQLQRIGDFEGALELTERQAEQSRRMELGPWTRLSNRGKRLTILQAMGRNDLVLREVEALRDEMAAFPPERGSNETVNPWNVRESILETGSQAAGDLKRHELALELRQASTQSKRDRGAGRLDLALSELSCYSALIALERYDETEELLRRCRVAIDAEQSREGLSLLYAGWASLADKRRHHAEAADFARRGLRIDYTLGIPTSIASDHNNLANYLRRGGADRELVLAHRIAAAMIGTRIGSGRIDTRLRSLAGALRLRAQSSPPPSFAEVCRQLKEHEGVDFGRRFDSLPGAALAAEEALERVVRQAEQIPVQDDAKILAEWDPHIALVARAAHGDREAAAEAEVLLGEMAAAVDWAALAAAFRRVLDGERELAALLDGLDAIDTALLQALFERLAAPPDAVSDTATAR